MASSSCSDTAMSSAEASTDAPPSGRGKLSCSRCKEPHACQWLYLLDVGDWQGGLTAICYDCYASDEDLGKKKWVSREQFKALANGRWNERKKKAGKHSSVARGITWKQAIQDIGHRHPGAVKRAWREELKVVARTIADFVSRAYKGMTDYNKLRFVVAFQEMEHNLKAVATDPTFVPTFDWKPLSDEPGADLSVQAQALAAAGLTNVGGTKGADLSVQDRIVADAGATIASLFFVPERTLDYASELMPGLDDFYLCRNMECRCFCPATCWVKQEGKDRFRCPLCITEYWPWRAKPSFMRPNKMLVASCNGDDAMAADLNMEKNEVRMWFVEWEDTSVAVTKRRLQEIQLNLEQECKDMSPQDLEQLVKAKVDATSERVYFTRRTLSVESISWLDNQNKGGKKKWMHQHLTQGFWAATAPEFIENVTKFLKNDDALTMWAYSRQLALYM